MVCVGAVRLRMHHALADRDGTCPALGAQLVEGGGLGTDAPVVLYICAAHRRGKHSVFEGYIADCNRRTEVRIFSFHSFFLSLRNYGGREH